MNVREQKKRAKAFVERWENRGDEKQDSQSFWLDLLESVFGVEYPSDYIQFEDKVMLDHTSFIDGYIEKTSVMIEQKGKTKDLGKAIKQSDGSFLTPFQQAKRYSANLPYSKRPRWIITSNFTEFFVYDMEQPNSEATVIQLKDLPTEYYRLEFLVDKGNETLVREMKISMQAGEIVGDIYDALLKQYIDPDSPSTQHGINQLIVRLVFCLYAEDAGLFGHKLMFHDYLAQFQSRDFRRALKDLFEVLNSPVEKRDPYIDDSLNAFPYVNGGMFAENDLEIPNFTDELSELILQHASSDFDWSNISPTIFGAVFESTLNPDTRRTGGMHYTSIENIHKVIDPLFLSKLVDELNDIRSYKQPNTVKLKAQEFQRKLSKLTFFDPACGSGNFLTETYLSLRRLENEAIKLYRGEEVGLDVGENLVQVKLDQFYGIEINDFAVSVAKTALWIAESQMLEETKDIVYANIDFLPLKSYTNIVEGNALELDWAEVVSPQVLRYIIGNPPFFGARLMTAQQKSDLKEVFQQKKGVGNLDFVSGWFLKAMRFIQGTNIQAALVSTNSITQGEQVELLWKRMFELNADIVFCYPTFKWESEASQKAAVHCVIISFMDKNFAGKIQKRIIRDKVVEKVRMISPYLIETDPVYVQSRSKPIADVPKLFFGSMANDGGYLSKFTDEKKSEIVSKYPQAEPFFKRFIGADELIKNKVRWCLWLKDASPSEWRKIAPISEAVASVKEVRENSSRASTKKLADIPYLFGEIRQPESDYLLIPRVSSENRRYIPIGFESPSSIASDAVLILPNASMVEFGVLTSNVHMGWVRTVAGRLESRQRYSVQVVYNNFPWVTLSDAQKEKISKTARKILEARALYPDASMSDLYDELAMPVELRKAHQENDKAVMEAYGMTKIHDGKKTWLSESETVAKLLSMYAKLTEDK